MLRLLFEKTGDAVWISHLDLMRLFQRAFKRANLQLTHTQGFNPRPSVSIALPLSVGVESKCELLDFSLEGDVPPFEEIEHRLNAALTRGVRVLQVYEGGRKLRELSLLRCRLELTYDGGVPADLPEAVRKLFTSETLLVPKKTKNGVQEQDIIPMLKEFDIKTTAENSIALEALVCCQNPTLNPMQLVEAIRMHLLPPDFAQCCRIEVYDAQNTIFR